METSLAAKQTAPQAGVGEMTVHMAKMGAKIFALGALALLAACQSIIPRGEQRPEGPPPVVSDEPVNIVATDSDRHLVALLLPVSGPDAEVGQSIANATQLALLDTNNSSIRMTTYDTAQGIEVAVRRALADGNKLILGPLRGDNVVAAADMARPAAVPIISFSNDIGVAGTNIFLMGHLPGQSVDRIVRYAKDKGMTRFGAIMPKNVYGQRAASNFASAVRDAGGQLVSVQDSDGSPASITAAVKRLSAAGSIDAVLLGDSGRVAAAIVPALRANGMTDVRILGTDRWNIDATLGSSPAMRGAWFASVSGGYYRQYAAKYQARFGKAPLRLSSLGYDAVLLVARVAQDWKLGTKFPIARLTDDGGFIGIDGAFRFRQNGMSERMLEVQEIRAEGIITIDAAPKLFTK